MDDLVNVILDWGTDGSKSGGDVSDSKNNGPHDGIDDVVDLIAVILN